MVRLVDAEKLKRGIKNHCIMPIWCHELVKAEIDATPTVDAVEVVRCKDCEYHVSDDDVGYECGYFGVYTRPDDFCSYGERRSDETD